MVRADCSAVEAGGDAEGGDAVLSLRKVRMGVCAVQHVESRDASGQVGVGERGFALVDGEAEEVTPEGGKGFLVPEQAPVGAGEREGDAHEPFVRFEEGERIGCCEKVPVSVAFDGDGGVEVG